MGTKRGVTVPFVGLLCAVTVGCSGGDAPKDSGSPEPATADAAPASAPEEGEQPFRGMMVYMADAPRFTDCGTSVSYPMAQEGDYLAAERAYLDARSGPGEPVLMTFQGVLARRPGMEGGEVDAVVVTAFGGVDPGRGCGGEPVTGLLEGTEWRLVALPGAGDVPADAVATLLLDPEGHRSSGSTGCNRFTGGYDLAGGRLTVSVSALTRMACPDPLATVEADYLEALRGAGTYRFAEGFLELLGEAGPVARFAPTER